MSNTQTAEKVADAIIALNNSRTQSPTKAELVAILAPAMGAPHSDSEAEVRLSALREAVRAVETRLGVCAESVEVDDLLQAADRRVGELARALWSTPPRTLGDLQERAVLARHALWTILDNADERRWKMPTDCEDWSEQCIAELIYAVENFAGELPAAAPARTIEPNAYAVDPRDPELREWEGAVARWLEAVQGANDDDEANRALKEFDAVAKAIWSRRVLSWNDIVLRAAVAIHWNDADPEDPDDEPAYPAAYLRSADDRLDMDAQALANLVQGIIDLSGLHFDRTGRVVPPPLSGSPWIRMGASRTFMRDLDHDQPSTLTGAELRAVGAALREVMPPLRAAFDTVNGMMPSAPEYPAAEARYRELSAHFNALVERLWTAAPSTWEGVMLLAEIAQFEAYDWPAPYPQIPLTGGDYIDADPARLALGHLAMAVLRMGGRRCARPALNETTSAQEVHHHE